MRAPRRQARRRHATCLQAQGRERRFAGLSGALLRLVLALTLGLSLARALPAAPRTAVATSAEALLVERPDSDLLLLALQLDRSILAETLSAYSERGRILVPFGEICRLLDLGITVDVARGLATGFFLRQDRLFHLDAVARKVIVEGKERRFDAEGVELHADDVYVDAALIAAWLPLHLEVNLYASLITVLPDEKLPLQLRLERAAKLGRAKAGRAATTTSLPHLDLPYRFWDGPFVDQTLRFDRRPEADRGGRNAIQYSTYATGDLLKMELGAFLAGTDSGVSDSRFSLGRKDPDGGLLGLLHAREATLGDVFHPGLDLIALPRSGPGVLLSNFPLQLPAQFDRQSFRGDLPPGWEVELYRGDELLDYSQSRTDGLYEFLDVPLLFGLNVFRLEFYGPQGQRRRELQRLNVGESLTPKGKVYFRLAGNAPSERLLGSGQLGVGRRGSLEVSAGLSRHLSASASLAGVDLRDGRHTYGLGSLRAYWSWIFANASVAADREGGSAWQATLQSRLGAFGLLAQHSQLRRFESEALVSGLGGTGGLPGSPALESRTLLRIDSALPESFLPRIPLTLEARQDRLADGRRLRRLNGRLSASRRGLFVSNQVNWTFASAGAPSDASFPATPTSAFGHLLVSKYLQTAALRGELDYDLRPEWEATSAQLTLERRFDRGLLLSAGVNRTFGSEQTRILLGCSRLEGTFGFGVTADYSRDTGFGVGVLLSESLGRDPRTGSWHPQARALAGTGALSGLAFLDFNGNGRKDPGEQAIAGAGFLVNGGGSLARTDDSGVAFLANLQPYQSFDLAVSPATLEDPYWKPADGGVRVLPRPGKVAQVDFPVQVSGEITGTLFLRRDGVSRIAGSVEMELVDRLGAVVQRARSAYDGFYDLAEVPPGHYHLRIAEPEVTRLGLTAAPSREVEIAPSGTIVEGLDFYLTGEGEEGREKAPNAAPPHVPGPSTAAPPTPPPGLPGGKPGSASPPQVESSADPRLPKFRSRDWRGTAPLYAVQVASLRDRPGAERHAHGLESQLRTRVHVLAVDLGAKGTWYRLLAGELPTAEAALAYRRRLQGVGFAEVGPAYEVVPDQ